MKPPGPDSPIGAARVVAHPRSAGAAPVVRDDVVAVEAPLEMRLGAGVSTVLMRTPGHDEELVRGFLFSEGLIGRLADVLSIERPEGLQGDEQGNVVRVELDPARKLPPLERTFYGTSSCGVCGKNSIASLAVRAQPSASRLQIAKAVLHTLPARLRTGQAVFAQTGGVHASGLFTPAGELVALREDVGRHNALDKVIGWALGAGRVPLDDVVLVVSGRVSYEIVQKAIAAGVPLVAAVGAPSSIAIDLAEQFGVTLVGFLGAETLNVYANGQRLV